MITWRTVFKNGARKFLRCAIGACNIQARIIPVWLFYRASPAGPLSVLATLPWGNVWVLVHTETAVSRLHQSLNIFEVGFVIRCGRPGSCVRPRHSSSNCVFYRLRGLEINISLVTVVCCCVECQSADCRFTLFGVIALMCMPI